MPLNIKNAEVEVLAREVARLANETKTEAIRRALLERKARLQIRRVNTSRRQRLEDLLKRRIWPEIPAAVLGESLSRDIEEEILGYGPHGVS